MYWVGYSSILIIGLTSLVWLLVRFQRRIPPRPMLQNLLLAVLALFMTAMALEFYFKLFFAQSDAITSLANRNWNEWYFDNTLNSLGYRDKEWTEAMVAGKIKVMAVGDSFVEGTGIEYPEDRFPDRLGQMLGPNYVVFNLGKGGAHTGQELDAVLDYPYPPDILILAYFINDIEGVAGAVDEQQPPRHEISPILLPLVRNSYAFNFIYWRLFRLAQIGQPDEKWEWQKSLHNNPDAWWLHRQQLLKFHEGSQAQGIHFIAVVFPSMNQPEDSLFVTERILKLYQEVGVPTLDVAQLITDIPVDERIATPVDPHPSELVHNRVAEALHQMFIDLNLAESASQVQQ
jgi:hypothetical protein